jgi:hypothetical protein
MKRRKESLGGEGKYDIEGKMRKIEKIYKSKAE